MTYRTWLNTATLIIGIALAGCVSPPGTSDSQLLHHVDSVMRQATPGMAVSLRLSAEQVKTGDVIAGEVRSGTAGYVYLFQMGTDGRTLSLVFPNAMDGANYIAAGSALALPRPNWRMSARGPAGVGHMMAVVTEQPLDLMALSIQVGLGRLALAAPYGAAMVVLRETAP